MMTNGILGWPGVTWTARLFIVLVLFGGGWIFALFLARFFRPRNVVGLVRSPIPRIAEVGGEFAGAEATIKFMEHGEALETVFGRLQMVERRMEELRLAAVETNGEVGRLREERDGGI